MDTKCINREEADVRISGHGTLTRFFSVLMALVFLGAFGIGGSGVTGVTAFAADDGITEGDWTYTVNEDNSTVSITKYNGTATEVIVPDTLGGKPVTAFSGFSGSFETSGAFSSNKQITSVSLPDTIITIGRYTFEYCTTLTSIKLSTALTYIGNSAFRGCKALTSIDIPDSVTSIGNSAFYGCYNLSTVVLPAGLQTIGDYSFRECSSLTEISLPESVTSIGEQVFSHCSSLIGINVDENNENYSSENGILYNKNKTELIICPYAMNVGDFTIPSTITSISSDAFGGCNALTGVTIPEGVTSIGRYAFSGCSSLRNVILPDSVTSIDWGVFSGCSSLESVTLPDSVASIGSSAFSGCSSLKSVTFPDSVTSIGERAFSGCSSLESVTLPDSDASIGEYAFSNCTSLKSVTLPANVASIASSVFSGCSSLTDINVDESNPNYSSENGVLYNKTKTELIFCLATINVSNFTIPSTVTLISSYAFEGCSNLESVTLPDSVTSIGEHAFSGCSSLKSVMLPDSVTTIGTCAFSDCTNLVDINIPNKVSSIGSVFINCSSLVKISLPESVVSIGDMAFGNCINLERVAIHNSNARIAGIKLSPFEDCSRSKLTIYGEDNSTAERFASSNNIQFADISKFDTYAITIPESVAVTVERNGVVMELKDQDEINKGETLTITVKPPVGNNLDWIHVNDEDFVNGSTFMVGDANVRVDVGYSAAEGYTITIPENITVKCGGDTLENNDAINTGDILTITAIPPKGQQLKSLTVNGTSFTSGNIYTVGETSVVITAEFEKISEVQKLTVTFPKNVIVTRTEVKLTSGGEVRSGDVLMITAVPPQGKVLELLTVNGAPIQNESRFTVGTENVVITAEFADEAAQVKPASIKIASKPDKTSYYIGQPLDIKGCAIVVTYSDGSTANIAVMESMISGFDSKTAGTKTVTVTYEGLTASFEVTVKRSSSGGGSPSSHRPSRPGSSTQTDSSSPASGGEVSGVSGVDTITGWNDVEDTIQSHSGGAVSLELHDNTAVPADVIMALYENKTTLTTKTDNGYTWTLDGSKVSGKVNAIDLSVVSGGYIPTYLIENEGGADAKRLSIDFDNRYEANLSFTLDNKYYGQYASLMRADKSLSRLEFVSSCAVGADGSVGFVPDIAGNYVVVVDGETKLFGDINNDGSFDFKDADDVLNYLVGFVDKPRRNNPDVNGDGEFNALDAAYILRKVSGQDTDLPQDAGN